VADALDIGDDEPEAGAERARIAAETLDGVVVALRHGAHAERDGQDDERDERHHDHVETRELHRLALPLPLPGEGKLTIATP